MKNFDEYKTKLPYPSKSNCAKYYLYKRGKVVLENVNRERVKEFLRGAVSPTDKLRTADFSIFDAAQKQGYVIEEISNQETLQEQMNAYRVDEARLIVEFTNDIFEDYGVTNHPGRHVMFGKAWENGHSAGLSEVYNCFGDVLDFVKLLETAVKEAAAAKPDFMQTRDANTGKVPVYMVVWIESEQGFGQKPFDKTYYDTIEQAQADIKEHWISEQLKNPSGQTPEWYIRPEDPTLTLLDRAEYNKIKKQNVGNSR